MCDDPRECDRDYDDRLGEGFDMMADDWMERNDQDQDFEFDFGFHYWDGDKE